MVQTTINVTITLSHYSTHRRRTLYFDPGSKNKLPKICNNQRKESQ